MFAAILGALMSGAGLAAQMGAQGDAQNLNWRNFYLQRDTAEENKRLAKAKRTDALGNAVEYVPGEGFVTRITPMTRAILNSMQFENLERNRVDAPRARAQRGTNFARRNEEDEASRAALGEYRFGSRKSEGEFASDAEDIALHSYDRANDDTTQALGRQAVRSGNTQATRNVFKERSKQKGESLIEAMLNAKMRGSEMFDAQEGRRGKKLQEALALSGDAGIIDPFQFGSDDALQRTDATQKSQFAGLSDAIKYLGQAEGGALTQLAQGEQDRGKALAAAFANIGSSLGGLDFGGSGTTKSTTSKSKPLQVAQAPMGGDDYYPFAELSSLGRQYDDYIKRTGGAVGAF